MKTKYLSVVVPVHNEESEIGKVIERLKKTLAVSAINYEIIVVNDASTDNTRNVAAQFNDVVLIDNSYNLGYGASLKTGIKKARYDIIAIIDGDNTYQAERITEMLGYIEDCDMVVGKRTKIVYPKLNYLKQSGRLFMDGMASFFAAEWIPDINSGFRLFGKSFVVQFSSKLCDGFSFTTSLTLMSCFKKRKIKYIEIDYMKEPTKRKSKVKIWKDGCKTLLMILNLGLKYAPGKFLLLVVLNFTAIYLIVRCVLLCVG
ncbi:MAG: glycosyltransferase family 2 protein [Endomicrobiia bacterium]|nr:glycosyltransferase family 2 protein [Endomicrobiia bacterium]